MFGIGPMELVVILVMALLVLGPKRMPELARTLGRGLGEFRRASSELRQSLALDDLQNELRDGLAGKSTPGKPGADTDRPAQAGDDLEPGRAKDTVDPGPTAKEPHPGELPLDADPHAHHDEAGNADSEAPEVSEPATAPASGTGRSARVDPDLGSVPVGGAGPDTKPDSPHSSDSGKERG